MSFLRRLARWGRRDYRFEDYDIETGYTREGLAYASIREFASLIAPGATHEEAVEELRRAFQSRVEFMRRNSERIPRPGSKPGRVGFAPNDQIEALRPFVDEFWSEILGTSYLTSYVSNQSQFDAWEQYVPGGRAALIERVKQRYGVDISEFYDEPLPLVLRRIRDQSAR